jgi:hypothetical protein
MQLENHNKNIENLEEDDDFYPGKINGDELLDF